jgi:hypothetical protein
MSMTDVRGRSVAESTAPQLRIQLVNDENSGSFMRSVRGLGIHRSSPSRWAASIESFAVDSWHIVAALSI